MAHAIKKVETLEECQAVADIYNQYLGIATMDLEEKDGQYYMDFLNQQDNMQELWIMGQDSIVCWGIIKKYSDRTGYRLTGETSVYCHPNHVGKGIGTIMKKHLMFRCKEVGYHHLIARINANNAVSIHYNEKLGYSLVGIQKEIGYVHGEWRDIAVMQCIL